MTEIDTRSYELDHGVPTDRRTSPVDFVFDALARNDFTDRVITGMLKRYDAWGKSREERYLQRQEQVSSAVDYLMALASCYEPDQENTTAPVAAKPYDYDGKDGFIVYCARRKMKQAEDTTTQAGQCHLNADTAEFSVTLFRGEAPNFYHQGRPVQFAHEGTLLKLEQMTSALRDVVMPPVEELAP